MSGVPSCASTAPSRATTIEWMMLCGWIDDLDALGREVEQPAGLDDLERLVHHRRGVDRDLAAHDPVRVRAGLVGRDARERGRVARAERAARTRSGRCGRCSRCHVDGSAGRHWKMAECSLSIGISVAPPCGTASTNRRRRPPALPCWPAAGACPRARPRRQAGRPAAPTIAAITWSTSGCAASSRARACRRAPRSAARGADARAQLVRRAGVAGIAAKRGCQRTTCAKSSSTRRCAVSAKTSKRRDAAR
jgi:hypothetical protein